MHLSKHHCLIHTLFTVINMKVLLHRLIVCLLCIGSLSTLSAQEVLTDSLPKVRGVMGFSLPELVHLGARYRFDDIEIGLNAGSFPTSGSLLTFTADCMIHLFDSYASTGQKAWYGKVGISSMHEDGEFEINDYTYAHLRFGHEFGLSKTVALQLDGGVMFELSHSEIEKKPSNSWFNFEFEFPILPSIGLTTVFYL